MEAVAIVALAALFAGCFKCVYLGSSKAPVIASFVVFALVEVACMVYVIVHVLNTSFATGMLWKALVTAAASDAVLLAVEVAYLGLTYAVVFDAGETAAEWRRVRKTAYWVLGAAISEALLTVPTVVAYIRRDKSAVSGIWGHLHILEKISIWILVTLPLQYLLCLVVGGNCYFLFWVSGKPDLLARFSSKSLGFISVFLVVVLFIDVLAYLVFPIRLATLTPSTALTDILLISVPPIASLVLSGILIAARRPTVDLSEQSELDKDCLEGHIYEEDDPAAIQSHDDQFAAP